MRFTDFLIPTLKEAPADAEIASHVLLVRGGFIRRLASGSYNWLPLGLRVVKNIERIVRQELQRAGAQEILMPVVQPAELWRDSGRWDVMGPEMLRLADRHGRDYCISPTQEEVVTDLVRRTVASYRQLPCNLYQIQTKFRDEIRPRFGLLRAREFIMKDGYSFHLDEPSFERTYAAMHDCYSRILERIGLRFRAVEADSGPIGDGESHEFHVLADTGEDTLVYSPSSDYAANLEAVPAPALADDAEAAGSQDRQAMRKVATPNAGTIDAVAALLDVPASRCVKTLVVHAEQGGLIALVLRGDHQLNEAKAARLPGVRGPLAFAAEAELRAELGVGAGSIGPVGLKAPLVVDGSAAALAHFVCGANENGHHYRGVRWARDVGETRVADIRNALPGDAAPDGSGPLAFARGIEVGHIFKLGTKYTQALDVAVQGADGVGVAPLMGCYGFGISRMVAAIAEQSHDDDGIVWPSAVAPFDVHIVALNNVRSAAVAETAARLHDSLQAAGFEALLDDRDERPGVKFSDADLIGIPHRVTVGDRGLKDGVVEYRRRIGGEVERLRPEEVASKLAAMARLAA